MHIVLYDNKIYPIFQDKSIKGNSYFWKVTSLWALMSICWSGKHNFIQRQEATLPCSASDPNCLLGRTFEVIQVCFMSKNAQIYLSKEPRQYPWHGAHRCTRRFPRYRWPCQDTCTPCSQGSRRSRARTGCMSAPWPSPCRYKARQSAPWHNPRTRKSCRPHPWDRSCIPHRAASWTGRGHTCHTWCPWSWAYRCSGRCRHTTGPLSLSSSRYKDCSLKRDNELDLKKENIEWKVKLDSYVYICSCK